ncbi:hypothetical protein [Synechococcus sp. LA31]|uniref:hypothetical protein n=1 Tax=Synechococcus sp. LA31 TaxID=2741953 RepID=UPI001BDD6F34|nr:hypothetical protein [Synechococcus sp. LA31]QVV66531.1 hypothetical protein KJJ24_08325 [Synechococcus sp. LA31]
MTTDPKLAAVAQAAAAQGLAVCHQREDCLEFYPQFKGALEDYTGVVVVQVCRTPLGLRYDVYEELAGGVLSPGGAHDIGDWLTVRLGRHIANAYWWSYRRIWGWLHSHRWIDLPQACRVAHKAAHQLHRECQRQDVELAALQEARNG